jgi:hypothetical protein
MKLKKKSFRLAKPGHELLEQAGDRPGSRIGKNATSKTKSIRKPSEKTSQRKAANTVRSKTASKSSAATRSEGNQELKTRASCKFSYFHLKIENLICFSTDFQGFLRTRHNQIFSRDIARRR